MSQHDGRGKYYGPGPKPKSAQVSRLESQWEEKFGPKDIKRFEQLYLELLDPARLPARILEELLVAYESNPTANEQELGEIIFIKLNAGFSMDSFMSNQLIEFIKITTGGFALTRIPENLAMVMTKMKEEEMAEFVMKVNLRLFDLIQESSFPFEKFPLLLRKITYYNKTKDMIAMHPDNPDNLKFVEKWRLMLFGKGLVDSPMGDNLDLFFDGITDGPLSDD